MSTIVHTHNQFGYSGYLLFNELQYFAVYVPHSYGYQPVLQHR